MSHRRAAPHPHPHPDHFHLHPLLIQLPFSNNNRGSFNSCQASSGTPPTESQRPISHHRNPTELKLRTEPRDAFDLKPAKWQSARGAGLSWLSSGPRSSFQDCQVLELPKFGSLHWFALFNLLFCFICGLTKPFPKMVD